MRTRYGADRVEGTARAGFYPWRSSSIEASVGGRAQSFRKGNYDGEPTIEDRVAAGSFPTPDGYERGYAAVVSADVATIVQGIATAWAPEGGDLAGTLAAAGGSGSPFKSDQAALNVVSDGLFYIEREVKDMKLGRPLGKVDCAEAACPAAVESQYARVGRDHVKNNLVGFKRVFDGCGEASARGFDDLLRSLGSADVASDMLSGLDGAIAAADALETSDLVTSLASERDKVEALHAAVKKVTDLLKTDFVTILDLEPPVIVEGDND